MKRLFAILLTIASMWGTALAQDSVPGLWFTNKKDMIVRSGMTEGDALVFARPVETLPAGTRVQFCVCMENLGEKAPLHYIVEFCDGGRWVADPDCVLDDGLAEYSFYTVSSSVRHPSTYLSVYCLRNSVSDTLKVRCRVSSSYAADGSTLSAVEPENQVSVKSKGYVGAYLNPLGTDEPSCSCNVLLVGNSFTYYFGEPYMLQEIAYSQGMLLNVSASLKGGQSFRQHCGLEVTQRTIAAGGYAYAFLQGQSQEPAQYAADPAGHEDVQRAYAELCGSIRRTSPDCKIYAENTWGYPALENGGFASLQEFDSRLTEGSLLLAESTGSFSSPVGPAFTAARDRYELLHTDAKHQGLAGSYLKACVTYLVISGKPFEGPVPKCGLPEEEAAYLRAVAEAVVLR